MKKIEYLIVHCSDSAAGDASIIRQWHTSPPRNWADIGYHYVILNGTRKKEFVPEDDGLIEAGRGLNNDIWIETGETGAHAIGYNKNSIGVCCIGKNKFTVKQFDSLICICEFFRKQIPNLQIKGHYEVCSYKTCPNFDIWKLNKLVETGRDAGPIKDFFKDNL